MAMHHMDNKIDEDSRTAKLPETNDTHENHSTTRPFYISVVISVMHCGAGCVLGDIVGEWIIYGGDVAINGRSLWPEMLIGIHTFLIADY